MIIREPDSTQDFQLIQHLYYSGRTLNTTGPVSIQEGKSDRVLRGLLRGNTMFPFVTWNLSIQMVLQDFTPQSWDRQ